MISWPRNPGGSWSAGAKPARGPGPCTRIATAVRDQCLAHGVNFFFKGWEEWIAEGLANNYPPNSRIRNGRVAGARCEHGYIYRRRRHDGMGYRYLDGRLWQEWPE